jgi:hypothetical protein
MQHRLHDFRGVTPATAAARSTIRVQSEKIKYARSVAKTIARGLIDMDKCGAALETKWLTGVFRRSYSVTECLVPMCVEIVQNMVKAHLKGA